MFNARQLLGLELSCQRIAAARNTRVRNSLATNLSDLLRYQNMLCRYDTMALKSLDIFSVHGFPVGLIQCESNLIGIGGNNGGNVGSGGWTNIIAKFSKAKEYANHPFEIRRVGKARIVVPIEGEWIGDSFGENGKVRPVRQVDLRCADSGTADLPDGSLDAVFTDPPYFGNVQYAELMDFCYVWLRKLVDGADAAFNKPSTRDAGELTGNVTLDRGLETFASGLSGVFCKMAKALKPRGPLAFTFHHNELSAYAPVALAILDAGLTCTATLPCPAEMSASIHISGTKSSIVDSVFVCRSEALPNLSQATPKTAPALAELVHGDLSLLAAAGRLASTGDILCIVNGHLARIAVSALHDTWNASLPIKDRLALVADKLARLPGPKAVKELLDTMPVAGVPVGAGRGLFDTLEDER
jgi:putative DNA methylase